MKNWNVSWRFVVSFNKLKVSRWCPVDWLEKKKKKRRNVCVCMLKGRCLYLMLQQIICRSHFTLNLSVKSCTLCMLKKTEIERFRDHFKTANSDYFYKLRIKISFVIFFTKLRTLLNSHDHHHKACFSQPSLIRRSNISSMQVAWCTTRLICIQFCTCFSWKVNRRGGDEVLTAHNRHNEDHL